MCCVRYVWWVLSKLWYPRWARGSWFLLFSWVYNMCALFFYWYIVLGDLNCCTEGLADVPKLDKASLKSYLNSLPITLYNILSEFTFGRLDTLLKKVDFPPVITKTRLLYNFNPLKPHFFIAKLEFTGVNIDFLIFLLKRIDCGYSLKAPRQGGSNEYPQSMFWAEIWKISECFIRKFSFFGCKIFNIFEQACFRKGRQLLWLPGCFLFASLHIECILKIVLFWQEIVCAILDVIPFEEVEQNIIFTALPSLKVHQFPLLK